MKRVFLITTAILLTTAAAWGAPDGLENHTHIKSVVSPQAAASGKLHCILLDREVYKELNAASSNLTLTDAQGKLVPFVLKKLQKFQNQSSYTPLSGKISGFQVDHAANTAIIEYSVDLKTGQKIGKLELSSNTKRQFSKSIVLEFADGSQVADLKFFNHRGTVDFSRYSFKIPPQSSGKVSIKIHPFAEKRNSSTALVRTGNRESFTEQTIATEELSLNKITFYAVQTNRVSAGDRTGEISVPHLPVKGKVDQSIFVFDLQQTPLYELKIYSATLNYHRQFTLEFYNNTPDGNQTIRKFSGVITPDFKLSLGEIRADNARLTIFNHADEPLKQMVFNWVVPQYALFLPPDTATPQGYLLYYGGSAQTPEFDLKHYIDKFSGQECTLWQLSASTRTQTAAANSASTWAQWMKKLLPYIIGAAALVLALFSIKMLRSAKFESDEDM